MVTTSFKETTPSSIQSPVSSTKRNGPISPLSPHKDRDQKKGHWFLRRLASEWSSFVTRLKVISEPRSPSEETLDSIFDSSDEDYFGRSPGKFNHVSPIENKFLLDYKKYRTLEKVYQAHKLATLHDPDPDPHSSSGPHLPTLLPAKRSVYSCTTEKSLHPSSTKSQRDSGSTSQSQSQNKTQINGQINGEVEIQSRGQSNSPPTKVRLLTAKMATPSTQLDISAGTTIDEEIKRTGSTTNGAVSDINSGTMESHELPNSADERIDPANPDASNSKENDSSQIDSNLIDSHNEENEIELDQNDSCHNNSDHNDLNHNDSTSPNDLNSPNDTNSNSNNLLPLPRRRRSTCNLGEKLWGERRNRWLETTLSGPEEIKKRQAALSLSHVNAKLHPQIYSMFVEKSKPLKSGTHINLEDLMNVINAGWTKEAKWERAARGLP